MAMVIIGIAQIFKDAGLGQAIIKSKKDIKNFVFTIQLFIGIILFLIFYLFSNKIALFYGNNAVGAIIEKLSLLFVIYPFIDVPIYINMKNLDFKIVFFRNTIGPIILAVVSITLALNNYGYWSLVYGQLISNIVIAIYFAFHYKLRLDINYSEYKEEIKFGIHIFSQGIISWINGYLDKLMMGKYLGKDQVGEFEIAHKFAGMIYRFIAMPLNQIIYPLFASLYNNNNHNKIIIVYFSLLKKISIIAVPLGVFIILNSKFIINIFLGNQWNNIIFVFNMLMIGIINSIIVSINKEIYKAVDKIDIFTKFLLFRTVIVIPVYFFTASINIEAVAIGRAILAIIIGPINLYILSRVLKIKYIEILKRLLIPFIVSILVIIMHYVVKIFVSYDIIAFILNIILFLIILFIVLKIYEPSLLKWRK
jgi:O-antigen/teichoic acid export membrane protein